MTKLKAVAGMATVILATESSATSEKNDAA